MARSVSERPWVGALRACSVEVLHSAWGACPLPLGQEQARGMKDRARGDIRTARWEVPQFIGAHDPALGPRGPILNSTGQPLLWALETEKRTWPMRPLPSRSLVRATGSEQAHTWTDAQAGQRRRSEPGEGEECVGVRTCYSRKEREGLSLGR